MLHQTPVTACIFRYWSKLINEYEDHILNHSVKATLRTKILDYPVWSYLTTCIGKEHTMHIEIHTITSQLVYTQLIKKRCMGGHTLLGIAFMCNQYRSCYVYSNYDSIVTKYVDPTIFHKHIWFNSYNTNVRSVILSVWHEWCFTNLIAIW
jgi:hypothetical protein